MWELKTQVVKNYISYFSPQILFLNFLFYLFLFLAVLDLCCCTAFLQLWGAGTTLQLQCMGFPFHWLLLWSPSSRVHGLQQLQQGVVVVPRLQSSDSVVVVHRFSCSTACGIFPDQGLNLCPLHWQADSLPLSYQGYPDDFLYFYVSTLFSLVFLYLLWVFGLWLP